MHAILPAPQDEIPLRVKDKFMLHTSQWTYRYIRSISLDVFIFELPLFKAKYTFILCREMQQGASGRSGEISDVIAAACLSLFFSVLFLRVFCFILAGAKI
jgi:hypothetical protein